MRNSKNFIRNYLGYFKYYNEYGLKSEFKHFFTFTLYFDLYVQKCAFIYACRMWGREPDQFLFKKRNLPYEVLNHH
jgi:hypothetical protein